MEYHNQLCAGLEILIEENILPGNISLKISQFYIIIKRVIKLLVLKQLFLLQIHMSKELHETLWRDQFFLLTKKIQNIFKYKKIIRKSKFVLKIK